MKRLWWLLGLLWLTGCSLFVPEGWQAIDPGGETVCSDGSEWKFYVREGDSKRVLVDFQGGGTCYDFATCSRPFATGTYLADLKPLEPFARKGIYDFNNPQNPFAGWTHVFIPYCTGDLHWGNATQAYGNLSIEHKGAVNARAALNWVYNHIQSPEKVFVTGCSAGSYGSIAWAPYLMRQYPKARVVQMGDSGLGVLPTGITWQSFTQWKPQATLPDWIPVLADARADLSKLTLSRVYMAVAKTYPTNHLAQYTTDQDYVQVGFYALLKGEISAAEMDQVYASGGGNLKAQTYTEWSQKAIAGLDSIKNQNTNFASFVASGRNHCVITADAFYTLKKGNLRLLDWINQLLQ